MKKNGEFLVLPRSLLMHNSWDIHIIYYANT